MAKKAPLGIRVMPIQHVVAEEITDPAEIAAEEEAAKQRRAARLAREELLARCQRLSSEKLRPVLGAVASQLDRYQQWDFLEDMTARLPADVLQRLVEELFPRRSGK